MTNLIKVDDDENLNEEQEELVFHFMLACPELRGDQVKVWSAMYPELAEEFEITAEILNEEHEHLELEGIGPDDEEADREMDVRVDRLLSTWESRLLIGTRL